MGPALLLPKNLEKVFAYLDKPLQTMSLQNRYHRRRVAESASKPCLVCYKSSSTVLITPDNADFFFTCAGHLDDKGFAEPVQEVEPSSSEKNFTEDLEKEIELVKKEHEEKVKRRKEKSKGKTEIVEGNGNDKTSQKPDDGEGAAATQELKERDEKIKNLEQKAKETPMSATQDNSNTGECRIYILNRYEPHS